MLTKAKRGRPKKCEFRLRFNSSRYQNVAENVISARFFFLFVCVVILYTSDIPFDFRSYITGIIFEIIILCKVDLLLRRLFMRLLMRLLLRLLMRSLSYMSTPQRRSSTPADALFDLRSILINGRKRALVFGVGRRPTLR